NWFAHDRNPECVGCRPRPEQDRSSIGQIDFDIAIQAFGDAAFIRSAIFRGDGWQIDLPAAVNYLERRPDLKCGKILRSDRAKPKERDHQAIAHSYGGRDSALRVLHCLNKQGEASPHKALGENPSVEL